MNLDEFLDKYEAENLKRGKIELTIPFIPPSQNHYVKHAVIAGRLRSYQTKEAKEYKSAVSVIARGRTIAPESGKERKKVKYRVVVTVFLGTKQRQDADNGLKVGIDALKEAGVIHSDARVQEAIGRVNWDLRPAQGYTYITAEVIH